MHQTTIFRTALISFFTTLVLVLTTTSVKAEIQKIQCPAEPPTVRRLQLQERWRIEADDPSAPVLGYFSPSQVMVHDEIVYMLDGQLCNVLVYSKNGEHLNTFMGEGDGPGEVRDPGQMFLTMDNYIAVQHGYPSKLEFVDLAGVPRGGWRLDANAWVMKFQETTQGWFAVYTASIRNNDPGVFSSGFHAALHDQDGQRTLEYFTEESKRNHQDNSSTKEIDEFKPWSSAIVLGHQEIVLSAMRNEYELHWFNIQGDLTRVVTREHPAHQRTKAELDEIRYRSYSIVNGDLKFKNQELCANDPVIISLNAQADGSLRVQTSLYEKDLAEGMVCRFEIHEPNGELRERVEIYDPTGDYDVAYDQIAILDHGQAIVLRNVRSAYRAAFDSRMHPKVQEKLPPIPDDREENEFTPVMCDLVPWSN